MNSRGKAAGGGGTEGGGGLGADLVRLQNPVEGAHLGAGASKTVGFLGFFDHEKCTNQRRIT